MPSSQPPSAPTGVPFGRYRLVEQLGEGGMAVVWRAVIDGPQGFARSVVIKRILPVLAKYPKFTQMFLAEARLCALLHHPGIVQVHDLGDVDGEYFLAMEFVDGFDLASMLKHCFEVGKKLPPGLACFIVLSLAEALAYAHALRDADGRQLEIVHRDISPSNVMVTPMGGVKLLDFGIAKAAKHVRDEQTRTGTLKGKISYMSPEQADGRKIDRRSDIFALGIVLYECLSSDRLFRGEDDLETLRLIREAKVWPPSSVRPEIEPDIDAVVLRMLAKTPDTRYQTCDEVAAALQPIVHRHHADASTLKKFLGELGPLPARANAPTTTPGKRSAAGSGSVEEKKDGTITRTQGEVLPSDPSVTPPTRSYRGAATLGGVVAAVALAAGIYLVRGAPNNPAATALPRPAVAPTVVTPPPPTPEPPAKPPTQPPAPRPIHFSVRGPAGSDVLVDGQLAGTLPFDADLPRVDGSRTLVVQRPGFFPWTRILNGSEDQTLTVTLKRRPPLAPRNDGEGIKDPFARDGLP